jgi:hypothetical protein
VWLLAALVLDLVVLFVWSAVWLAVARVYILDDPLRPWRNRRNRNLLLTIIVAARGNSSCNFQFFILFSSRYLCTASSAQLPEIEHDIPLNRLKHQAKVENRACNLVLFTYINI